MTCTKETPNRMARVHQNIEILETIFNERIDPFGQDTLKLILECKSCKRQMNITVNGY